MQVSHCCGGMPLAHDFSKVRQQMFTRADGNGDGGLDIDEFKGMGKNLPGGKKVSASDDKIAELFNKMDTDHDGKLTQTEMDAARPKHMRPPLDMLLQAQQDGSSSAAASGNDGTDQKGASTLVQKLQNLYTALSNPIRTSTAASVTA